MRPHEVSRRKFIQNGVVLGGGIMMSPSLTFGTARSSTQQQDIWYRQPLRILQTVLREPDAANYNAVSVVDYMVKTGCNTLIVNGGGIVDFFQNPLPAANINSFMGKKDVLKEITEACHAAGIRVVARVDFRGVEEKIYKQYPEWFSVDQTQKPIQLTYTRPQLYAGCYNGYYRNEHAEEFIRHIMSTYKLDGIWHNSIGIQGICYCPRCRESYRAASASKIPALSSSTVELDRYMKWKSERANAHMEHMKKTVKAFGGDKVYTAEVFSMFTPGGRISDGIDLYMARDHFDFLVSVAFLTENTETIEYADLGYAGTIIKFLKSMAPEKEAIILYGGNGTSHRYIMDPPLDLKVWLWEALSAGGRFWNCSFTGMHPAATYDRRNAFHQTEIYQFVKKHEKILAQHTAVASIGIYYSRPTRLSYRGAAPGHDRFESAIKGMEIVLTENHIPYDFIADDQVTVEKLGKYRLIILPNVKCLSQKESDLLKAFVAGGGNLLATHETSLYSVDGDALKDFALADVLGCHYTGEKVNTRKDCYQYILDASHALVKDDSRNTELYINAGHTLMCKPAATARMICTYVPMVQNQPPEKAWATEWAREFPTVLENQYQKGKVIYFANQPDVVSYEMGHPDMRNLLLRSIRHLAAESMVIQTNAPESVHAGLTQSLHRHNEYIFSFVNTTSGPARPLRSLLPVFALDVKLKLGSKSLATFNVLRASGKCDVSSQGGEITIKLEKLEDFFAVHLVVQG